MITVIIPSHNPNPVFLQRTLEALRGQSLPATEWHLLIIDDGSPTPLENDLVSWHPAARVVRESRLGLTYARLRAIEEANSDLLVWVDDDNVLASDYLHVVQVSFAKHPQLGIAGGRSIAEYQCKPPVWYQPNLAPLGCRDLGEQPIFSRWDPQNPDYPSSAPIGAGMVTRRLAIQPWVDAVLADPKRQTLGRKGKSLTSGEDNDINLSALRAGWEVAYLPQLDLIHLIPPGRLSQEYLGRLARTSYRDFIRVLDIHGIRPWPRIHRFSLPLRSARTWLSLKAWRGPAERIRWYSSLGQFEGRAKLRDA